MKSSQVAGLTAGWLTVALSMAAIGSASVSRVGVDNAESQPQVTVTRTIAVEKVDKAVPTPIAATDIAAAITAPTQVSAASLGQYAKPVTTTRTSVPTSAQTPPASPPITSATTPSDVPGSGSGSGTPGDTPASPPPIVTVPKPTPSPTKDPSEGHGSAPGSPGASPSFGVWRHAQGVIWAGCAGQVLTFLDARPSYGYTVTQRTSPVRAAVTFSGPTTASVRINCTFGQPSFDTTR